MRGSKPDLSSYFQRMAEVARLVASIPGVTDSELVRHPFSDDSLPTLTFLRGAVRGRLTPEFGTASYHVELCQPDAEPLRACVSLERALLLIQG